jgi:hypothetical protein
MLDLSQAILSCFIAKKFSLYLPQCEEESLLAWLSTVTWTGQIHC